MPRASFAGISLLFFLLAIAGAGCSGKIEGSVFLDENGNNSRDQNEPGISKILYSVTLDGNIIKSGTTNDAKSLEGQFSFTANDKGYYCVEIKKTAMAYLEPSTAPQIAKPPAAAKKSLPSKAGETASTSGTSTTATTTPATAGDTKADDTEESDTSNDSQETVKEPELPDITQSLKTCANSKGYGEKLRLDVPVAKDFEGSVAKLPETQIIEAGVGENFFYDINYPCSCKPLNFSLPETIIPAINKGDGNMLDISALISKAEKVDLPSYDITVDKMCKVTTELQLASGSGSEEVELSPQALCPNDSVIKLATQTVKWKAAKVKIDQKIDYSGDATKIWGSDLKLVTTIKNYYPVKGGDENLAKLAIKLPKYSVAVKVDTRCSSQIQAVSCDVATGDETPYEITFRFPKIEEINIYEEDLEFVIETSLQTPDSDEAIKADSIPINPPFPQKTEGS